MIRFDHVYKRYPNGREALSDLSLEIDSGEIVFLTGHSGAGKSSLLKLISLIERPSRGQLIVNNQNVNGVSRSKVPAFRRQIGMVFQDHKLLFDRSAFANVALPLAIAGYAPREAARRVRAALDKVGLLDREKADPIQLSGGEQQRLAIARAIVNRPALLIADEPTGNLDADYATTIMDLFRSFNQVGVTVIVSTHDPGLGARYPVRRFNLESGRLAA